MELQAIRRVHSPIYIPGETFFNKLEVQGGKEFITVEKSAHYPNEEDFKIIIDKLMKVSKRR